jgi:hypothetical protein
MLKCWIESSEVRITKSSELETKGSTFALSSPEKQNYAGSVAAGRSRDLLQSSRHSMSGVTVIIPVKSPDTQGLEMRAYTALRMSSAIGSCS